MVLYLYNVCNICNKNMRTNMVFSYSFCGVQICKHQIMNVQGKNDMFVLFAFKWEMFALCSPGRNGVTAI